MLPNFGGPPFPLYGPGGSQSVAPPWEELWGLKKGPIRRVKIGHFSPVSLARGKGQDAPNGRTQMPDVRGAGVTASPGLQGWHWGCCCSAPSPLSLAQFPSKKNKLEAGLHPLGEVMGTCCQPQGRIQQVPYLRGTGDMAFPGLQVWCWGRLPYQPQGDYHWKNQSAGIFTKLSGDGGRGVGRCAVKMAGGCHLWLGAGQLRVNVPNHINPP